MSGAEERPEVGLADLPEKTITQAWEVFASHPTDALYIHAYLTGTPKPMAADLANRVHFARLDSWLNNATPQQAALAGRLAEAYIHNTTDESFAHVSQEIPGV